MGLRENVKQVVGWPERADPVIGMQGWLEMFNYLGQTYQLGLNQSYGGQKADEIGADFASRAQGAYKSNGVVFACMLARQMLFSEARFMFRELNRGVPGDFRRTPALSVLETPWPNGTTGNLLSRALLDVDLFGNYFGVRRLGTNTVVRARPDWMTIVCGSKSNEESYAGDLDAEILGYLFHPGGPRSGRDPVPLRVDEVAHFAPHPDPMATYRGASPLSPIVREIMADQATTTHKLKFFENGATPNMIIKSDVGNPEALAKWADYFQLHNEGTRNAYKNLFVGQGMDATVVGTDFKQLDFAVTQGAGEVRICNAFRVPPIIVGVSEGLDSATYSNIQQATRIFADGTMRPLWREACGSFATIVTVPRKSELWYDTRDIAWLKEDEKVISEIQQTEAQAMKAAVEAGFDAESVVKWILTNDPAVLKHTGLTSVQLIPPGTKVFEPSGSVKPAIAKPEQGSPGAPASTAPVQPGGSNGAPAPPSK